MDNSREYVICMKMSQTEKRSQQQWKRDGEREIRGASAWGESLKSSTFHEVFVSQYTARIKGSFCKGGGKNPYGRSIKTSACSASCKNRGKEKEVMEKKVTDSSYLPLEEV